MVSNAQADFINSQSAKIHKLEERIAELEAALQHRRECYDLLEGISAQSDERAKKAEAQFQDVVAQFIRWGIDTSNENPNVMVNLLGDEREEARTQRDAALEVCRTALSAIYACSQWGESKIEIQAANGLRAALGDD